MSLEQVFKNGVEAAKRIESKLDGLDHGLRIELAALSTEIRTERRIGDDERKALHLRLDDVEAKLDSIASAISALGARRG